MQTSHRTTELSKSSNLPVTLDEAKRHLRILGEDLNDDVTGALEAATEYCEAIVGRSLRSTTTLTQSYRCWPKAPVWFDREPVASVTHVKYYDTTGTLTTVSSSYYRLHQQSEASATLEWDDSFSFPALDARDDAVIVTYAAGYGAVSSVPARAKHAVKLALSLFFGDLTEKDVEPTRRACSDLLRSIDWGCYR